MVETIAWKDNQVIMIDQRKLPLEEKYVVCKGYRSVVRAIRSMVIRGAPAIGVAAAMGIALGASKIRTGRMELFQKKLDVICSEMLAARPTAVNLAWAVERMQQVVHNNRFKEVKKIQALLINEAQQILHEDVAINRIMGHFGQKLLHDGSRILTYCNTGSLATGGHGTALGIVRSAVRTGKSIDVFACETRPFLQGARLTTWELMASRIPVTLITDNAAGHLMKEGRIDAVIVGADRIASNGDVANKIGTYMVAVLAKTHKIPFYVAAPLSTIDFSIKNGDNIPLEQRNAGEVTHFQGKRVAPPGVAVENPAFDVTPCRYVSAFITEKGVVTPPFETNLYRLLKS
jgi:methylthioribose-1-phosphate isomerase